MKHVFARRLGVLTLGTALAIGSYVPAAQADPSPSAASAGSWLLGDLPAQNYYSYTTFAGADTGLTIDAGLAGIATGNGALIGRTQAGVAATVGEYTSFGSSTYGNSTAKALAFATRSGANPRNLGGRDLVAQLEALVRPNGRISDSDAIADPANDDFTNVLGQGFAAEGLSAAGSPKAPAVLSYLQGLQCSSGAFGLDLPPADAAASCTDTSANPGADTTSLVGTSLARLAPTAPINTTIARAGAFLASTGRGGAFGDSAGGPTAETNTNSTGLAASLLGASCRVSAADQAADQVRALQLANGAVALNQAAFNAAQTEGITESTRDQFRRSTSQAATGLVWDASAAPSITLAGPGKRVAKGTPQTLTISGAARGETVCLTTPTGVQRLVGTGAPLTVPVTAPATGAAGYSATTGPGAATYALRTGNPKAQLKTKRVTPGGAVRMKLVSLVPGTKVVTKIRGTKVDRTRAKANGVASVKFRLTGKAAKAARVSTIRPGQVRKVTLKIKPAGVKAVKKTLRVARP